MPRKTESEMSANDLREWCVRHKFLTSGGSIAEAVRRGACEALRISRRQLYGYLSGEDAIPGTIALIADFYDWYPKRIKLTREKETAI